MDEETEELERNDNDTPEEAEEVETDEMTSEEAHRYDEFREVRGMLEELLGEIRTMRQEFTDGIGIMVENGATIQDVDGDGDTDLVIDNPDVYTGSFDFGIADDEEINLDL